MIARHDYDGSRVFARLLILSIVLSSSACLADMETPAVLLGPNAGGIEIGPGVNLTGVDLFGSRFIGQDLHDAVFNGCNLNGVTFYQCNLRNASFRRTVLTGACIEECDIQGVDFADAWINDMRPWSITETKAHGLKMTPEQLISTRNWRTKNLNDCIITACDGLGFENATLRNATIEFADVRECRFGDAHIDGLSLLYCKIRFEHLLATRQFARKLPLRIHLGGVRVEGKCNFAGMDLSGSTFGGILTPDGGPADLDFTAATIRGCVFNETLTEKCLYSTFSYKEGDLSGLALARTDWDLSRQNLTGASFSACRFSGTKMNDAVISDVNFAKNRFVPSIDLTVEQVKSTWNYKQGRMAGIVLPEELAEALRQEQEAKP